MGYALGENGYLSGENLNSFEIILYNTNNDKVNNHDSFTIDMTNYFKEADTKHPDVQYYQIAVKLWYNNTSNNNNLSQETFLTPLLRRGAINNKQSSSNDVGAIVAWFTDAKTLAVRIKCSADNDPSNFSYDRVDVDVYGFTYQDIGAGL